MDKKFYETPEIELVECVSEGYLVSASDLEGGGVDPDMGGGKTDEPDPDLW
ncbi:MAG: hypothetical protein IJ635_00380 [Bacteroidaceae bacterium]|nr:hypothetical protein [Bacteroidaceae bacterium]